MNPSHKTALITGGAHRIGKAITLALARAEANVVINYHASAAAAEETAAEARALGVQALPVRADISDNDQVQAMFHLVEERLGGVDILVNSASLYLPTPFPTADHSGWRRVTSIGIDGPYFCANAAAPGMVARGQGVIINITDLSAFEPWPGLIAHSVSKAALMALTRQLALELAPAVRVNAVAPGPVLPPPDYSPGRIARTADKTLLGRWGTPQDVADAVLYFVKAAYVTGDILFIDGGERFGHRKHEGG